MFKDFDEIINDLGKEDTFPEMKKLMKYSGLLKIAMSLFEGKKGEQITFHKIFTIISGFFENIPELKKYKDLLGMMELLLNTFRKQSR
jgi:hypothetical protein